MRIFLCVLCMMLWHTVCLAVPSFPQGCSVIDRTETLTKEDVSYLHNLCGILEERTGKKLRILAVKCMSADGGAGQIVSVDKDAYAEAVRADGNCDILLLLSMKETAVTINAQKGVLETSKEIIYNNTLPYLKTEDIPAAVKNTASEIVNVLMEEDTLRRNRNYYGWW